MSIEISNNLIPVNNDKVNSKVQNDTKSKSDDFSNVLEKNSQLLSQKDIESNTQNITQDSSEDLKYDNNDDKKKSLDDSKLDELIQLLMTLSPDDLQKLNSILNLKDLNPKLSQLLKEDMGKLSDIVSNQQMIGSNNGLINTQQNKEAGNEIKKLFSSILSESIVNKEIESGNNVLPENLMGSLTLAKQEQKKEENISKNLNPLSTDNQNRNITELEQSLKALAKEIVSTKNTNNGKTILNHVIRKIEKELNTSNSTEAGNKINLNDKNELSATITKAKTSSQRGEKLLDSILSEDKDSKSSGSLLQDNKITKAVNFMNQFQGIRDNYPAVSAAKVDININRPQLAQDIIKNLKYMETNGIKEMTVKIAPKELGEVIIKLTMDGSIMKANLTVTNKDAYNILNSNLQDISNKLSEQNMKIHSFNVNIYNGDSSFMNENSNSDNFSRKHGQRSKSNLGIDEINDNLEVENDFMEDGKVNVLA